MLKKLITLLVGKIAWTTPPWINQLKHKAQANPKQFWGRSVVILFALLVIAYGYYWYQHLPQPELVVTQVTVPTLTPNDKVLIPDNLTLDFGVRYDDELTPRSVAPISLVGKDVTTGISMTPSIPGKWVWQSDSELVFTPAIDWPAGQTYTITFAKNFFAPGSKLAKWTTNFTTLPFSAIITDFKFYQDPVQPQLRLAVATINFSHPINTLSLENNVDLIWQALKTHDLSLDEQHFKYTLSYDTHKRIAYLHSEGLPLPLVERYLVLKLGKGLQPLSGPSETTEPLQATVLIPDAASYFKVSSANSSIVRNQQDQPQQVLTIETTLGVKQNLLDQHLHVYVLPQDYPANGAEAAKPNYAWQDPGEVTADILAQAKPLSLHTIPADRDYSTLHSYRYQAPTPAYLYIKLDKGIQGYGDFVLANNYTTIVAVPPYPQEINFLHKGSLMALGSEEKLSVLVRGLPAVKFNIARILPDAVNHLITQTGGNFSDPYFINYNFNQDNISQIFTRVQTFNADDPASAQYTALDLGKYIATAGNGPLGLFLLQAQGWDTSKNILLHGHASRLILITDLGLLVKDNLDGTHDVYVQSIANGTPVNNASVAILGKNGLPLLSAHTDTQGHASFINLKDFTNQNEPTVYIARNGNDVAFIPYARPDRQLNYSRFDIGGTTSSNQTGALSAYLFSDRGIYRPGDLAHIGMIIKQPFVVPAIAGIPLEVTVTDPRGTTVKDTKLTLDDSGYLSIDFQTNADAPTGNYLVNLYIVKDKRASNLIGTTSLTVAEFLPDRMRISEHLSQAPVNEGWISPAGLTSKIGLWNLYGAPAGNHKISGKILLAPQAVKFKSYPDYVFNDPLLNPKTPPKVLTDTLPDTHTDAAGQAELDLKLDRFEKATYQLTVFAEGFELQGGRSVTTQTSALVSPLEYLVGYKADGDLNYIQQNGARHIHLIAINPQLKQQELNKLSLQLSSLHPVSTLVKNEDGTYQYQSVTQTTQISANPITIPEQGLDYALATQSIGDYLLTITDTNGVELTRLKFSVIGTSQQPLPKNAELSVKLNKSVFNAGDDIEMQISSPYTGAGLITIERDKVYAAQWFKTNSTTSVQKIHIPNDFQGNGYINIAFVRDLNSPEIYLSPLSYSIVPFTVTHANQSINVSLGATTLARPGEPLTITYKTDKPGKIIVFAVDLGILQVAKYKTPDPLEFFFAKHALEVNTQQIVDQILPKFVAERELSAIGGDAGEARLFKNLNPFKRQTEAPVVYWSGMLDTDMTDHALTYNVPDYFNGSLQIMAVAVATNAVGAKSVNTEVRGHFVINPNVPTFVAPGDEFDVTVGVANNVTGSGNAAKVNVALNATPQIALLDQAQQTVLIPEGQETSVQFKVRAKAMLGSANLKFTANLVDKTSVMSATLSVRPASAYATALTSGYSTDAYKSLALDRVMYPDYRKVELAVSSSPIILVAGLRNYLQDYPYGCVEQLVSKAFPWLVMSKLNWFVHDAATLNDKIQRTIQMLGQRQMASGAFNYWPEVGTTHSNDFASVYAMHFLTEAKEQGYSVPSDVFSNGIGFLRDLATQNITSMEQARLQAYAIYVLTRNEIVTTNYLTNLQLTLEQTPAYPWHKDITSVYIASTYQLLKNSTDANKLVAYYQPTDKPAAGEDDFYNQSIADAQYLYLIARHFPDRLATVSNTTIMQLVSALNANNMSTILAGYSSLALATYGQFSTQPTASVLSLHEKIGAQETGLSSANDIYQIATVDNNASEVSVSNPSKAAYFYQLTQAGFDKSPAKTVINQGIEVYRELRDANDKSVTSVKLGDEVYVHIRARTIDNLTHGNIAIVDLLPGGFEVVRESVTNKGMDYVDMREDRVIFFGTLTPDSMEIVYRIKATNTGQFVVPGIFGQAMYNAGLRSVGVGSQMGIE